jgi:hypothetical protein
MGVERESEREIKRGDRCTRERERERERERGMTYKSAYALLRTCVCS